MRAIVIGAGVAGLTCALALAERGVAVEIVERGDRLGARSCSWYAGGMLAPWCELESGEPLVAALGAEAFGYWTRLCPSATRNGSLVVAQPRDLPELSRFARRTERFAWLDGEAVAALEPDLAGRFGKALFFAEEGHLDPRAALAALADRLAGLVVPIHFGVDAERDPPAAPVVVDCRGLAARDTLCDLRGVRGEMLMIRSREIALARPVRMLHPRFPLYVVPRGDGRFMVGATMIESDEPRRPSARGLLELLGAAHALHPAFGEAEVVETGAGVRPAFADNLPRIRRRGRTIHVNGLFRHGFLLAPALARRVAGIVLDGAHFPEVMDEDQVQRRIA